MYYITYNSETVVYDRHGENTSCYSYKELFNERYSKSSERNCIGEE